jgi:hypothetical protein
MFGVISRLKNALTALAGNVEGLAGTVAQIDRGLQDRLGLAPIEAPDRLALAVLDGDTEPDVKARGKRGRGA